MAKVVDIERAKVDRLAAEMKPALRAAIEANGSYLVKVTELEGVERWRRAARKCARGLGIAVRTGVSADGSTVWVIDNRPGTEAEHRDAAQVIGDAMFGPSPRRQRALHAVDEEEAGPAT